MIAAPVFDDPLHPGPFVMGFEDLAGLDPVPDGAGQVVGQVHQRGSAPVIREQAVRVGLERATEGSHEFGRSTPEGVDVLVVIPHGDDPGLLGGFGQQLDELPLLGVHILELVEHEHALVRDRRHVHLVVPDGLHGPADHGLGLVQVTELSEQFKAQPVEGGHPEQASVFRHHALDAFPELQRCRT